MTFRNGITIAAFLTAGVLTAKFQQDYSYPIVSILAMIGFCIPAFLSIRAHRGTKSAIIACTALGLFALGFETIAILTGFPYGTFSYAETLGPKIAGVTPLSVFFGWTPIVIGTAVLGRYIPTKQIFFSGLALLILADLVIDPGATALGFWIWESDAVSFYGVPLQNFAGWALSGAVGIFIAQKFFPKKPSRSDKYALHGLLFITSFWVGVDVHEQLIAAVILGILLVIFIVQAVDASTKSPIESAREVK